MIHALPTKKKTYPNRSNECLCMIAHAPSRIKSDNTVFPLWKECSLSLIMMLTMMKILI